MSENKKVEKNCLISTFTVLTEYFHAQRSNPQHRRCDYVRVSQSLARDILANNKTMIINGEVKHFSIENIGLNCYQVRLNDQDETLYFKRQK